MSGTSSSTKTFTYTNEDVSKVVRRFTTDLQMIADSTKTITQEKAKDYGADMEYLAQRGFLKMVDVTLLSGSTEIKAVQYAVEIGNKDLTSSRPGDVLWPVVKDATLRVIVTYTKDYTAEQKEKHKLSLQINWTPTDESTDHISLKQSGGRDYSSSAFGVTRKDFT